MSHAEQHLPLKLISQPPLLASISCIFLNLKCDIITHELFIFPGKYNTHLSMVTFVEMFEKIHLSLPVNSKKFFFKVCSSSEGLA